MRSVAEVLSDQNRALLKVIRETNPDSVAVLARTTRRQPSNLPRTRTSPMGAIAHQKRTQQWAGAYEGHDSEGGHHRRHCLRQLTLRVVGAPF